MSTTITAHFSKNHYGTNSKNLNKMETALTTAQNQNKALAQKALHEQVKQNLEKFKPVNEIALAIARGIQKPVNLALVNRDQELQATVYAALLMQLGKLAAMLGANKTGMANENLNTLISEMAGDILTHSDFQLIDVAMLPAFFRDYRTGKFGPDYNRFDVHTICLALRQFQESVLVETAKAIKKVEQEKAEQENNEWDKKLADPKFKAKQQAAMRKCLAENPYVQAAIQKEKREMPSINREEHFKIKAENRQRFETNLSKMDLETCELLQNDLTIHFKTLDADTEQWALALIQQRINELSQTT